MRLNFENRKVILARALNGGALVDRAKALRHEECKLAREAYEHCFTIGVRRHARDIGDAWVSVRSEFRLNVAGAQIHMQHEQPLPMPKEQYGACANIAAGDLSGRIMAWAGAVETLKKDRKTAEHAIQAMLDNVSSVKMLEQVWPEGRQFYSDLTLRKTDLPAVVGTEINKLLGVA